MRIGQKVARQPETITEREGSRYAPLKTLSGRVVYIHPRGRYHTVEFRLRGGTIRESFPGTED